MSDRPRDARHAPLAAALSGLSPAEATARLIERDIVLDWAPEIEGTRAGDALIRATANLVVRFCPSLRIRPSSAMAGSVADLMKAIDSSAEPDRTPRGDALRVHLGGGAAADVTASASGWIAAVSGYGESLPCLLHEGPGVGAHGAAAFAASQVFARALPFDPRRAGPSPLTNFSIFDYVAGGSNPRLELLPPIVRALLAGAGAVGQACVDVLVGVGATGGLTAVDLGFVDDPTNLNRSALAVEQDLVDRIAKVRLTERRAQGTGLEMDVVAQPIADVVAEIQAGARPTPLVVLSALDNRLARWELQSIWPDLVLEGATGDSMVQIFRHAHGQATACLRCLHLEEDGQEGPSYLVRMADLTGLPPERLKAGLDDVADLLTAEDLANANPGARELLADHLGGDVCGFLSDVERLLGSGGESPQLSVAFSSYLAGVFLAGELLKASAGMASPLAGRYQIDPLATLTPGTPFLQRPSPTCFCQLRRSAITAIRARRLRISARSAKR